MKPFIVHDVAQRTPEWEALRRGRLTSTDADALLATRQDGKPAAGRKNLLGQMALERITGKSLDRGFVSKAMQAGIEREIDAVSIYEALTGIVLTRVGFVSHSTLMAGLSPDGVIGDFEGLVEIKSPIEATHLEYLETRKVPLDYMRQVIHGQWLTGARYTDWLSYQPSFPDNLRALCVRVERDEDAIENYDKKARAFLEEVDLKVAAIRTMGNLPAVLREAVA
jgi:hypothetical protein